MMHTKSVWTSLSLVLLLALVACARDISSPSAFPTPGPWVGIVGVDCTVPSASRLGNGYFIRVSGDSSNDACDVRGALDGCTVDQPMGGNPAGVMAVAPKGIVLERTSTTAAAIHCGAQALNLFVRWDPEESGVRTLAHRGADGVAPENTLAAFNTAGSLGYQGFETDVRFTADSVPVILHDQTVDRTSNGVGVISSMSFAAARQLDFGSWKGEQFRGERIPTVRETAALASSLGIQMVIFEMKQHQPFGSAEQAAAAIGKAVTASIGSETRWMLSSFSPAHLQASRKVNPGIPVVLNYSGRAGDSLYAIVRQLRPDWVALSAVQVGFARVDTVRVALKALGTDLMLWDLADPANDLRAAGSSVPMYLSDAPWAVVAPRRSMASGAAERRSASAAHRAGF